MILVAWAQIQIRESPHREKGEKNPVNFLIITKIFYTHLFVFFMKKSVKLLFIRKWLMKNMLISKNFRGENNRTV